MRTLCLCIWFVVEAAAFAGAATTGELMAQLASPDAGEREAAAWALGAAADPAAVNGLISALRDTQAGVRVTAAWALTEIGTPEALRTAYGLLGNKDDDVATFLFQRLEIKYDPVAQSALVRVMTSHPNAELRAHALAILDKNYTDDLLPTFQGVAQGDDAALKIKALPILVRRKVVSSGDDLLPIFVSFLHHPDPKVRQEAVLGLRGFEDERVRELLGESVADRDPEVHRTALSAVASMVDTISFPQLARLYDAGSGKDRATILGSVSLERREIMEPLYRKALIDRFAEPRRLLMSVMRHNVGGWALPGEWLLPFCQQGAKDADVEARTDAGACLARHPQASWTTLTALARDTAPAVRVEVLKGLKERYDAAAREGSRERDPAAHDIFARAASDPDPDIRVLGLSGLAITVEPQDRPQALQALLKDPAPKVRAAAVAALGAYEKSTAPLAVAALADPAPDVRAAAAERLWQSKPKGWIDTLGGLLDDRVPEVRRAASELLRYESDGKTWPYMLKALDDTDSEVRRNGAMSSASSKNPAAIEKLKALRQSDPDFIVRSFAETALREQNALPGQPSLLHGTSGGRLPPEVLALFVFPGRVPRSVMGAPNARLLGRYEAVDKQNTPQAFLTMLVEKDDKGRIFYTSWGQRDEAEVVDRFTALKVSPSTRYVAFWTPDGAYQLLTWTRSRYGETRGLIALTPSADGSALTYSQKSETLQQEDPSVTSLKEQFKKNPKKLAEAMQRMGLKEGPHVTFNDTTYVFRRAPK